jgi:hypothetical protein
VPTNFQEAFVLLDADRAPAPSPNRDSMLLSVAIENLRVPLIGPTWLGSQSDWPGRIMPTPRIT